MPVKFTNNAFSTLASSISNSATTISLSAGTGSRFPSLSGSDVFYATLVDSSNNLEIVKVTARSTDTLTVVRGQDGTSARAYTGGDRVELRPVAATLENMVQLDGAQTVSGDKTFSGTISFTDNASFTNTITGSISGNAATVTNGVYTTGNQTIGGDKTFTGGTRLQSNTLIGANDVLIYEGSTNTLNIRTGSSSFYRYFGFGSNGDFEVSNGNITASGNITAYSDERLKSDIKTIEGALDSVKLLRGVSFKKDGKNDIGVIAQEVQSVFPEVVHENKDGYLSVAYGNLVGVLIEAVKELSAKVEALEAK